MPYAWPKTSGGQYADPKDAAAYARIVLDAIAAGDAEFTFVPLHSEWNGHHAVFKVLQKPIRIDGFYPGAGARLAQQVADLIGCVFTTARLADLSYTQAAVKLQPIGLVQTSDDTLTMQDVSTMRRYAKLLDAAAEEAGWKGQGILNTVGKPWIIDNKLTFTPLMAENYGWTIEANKRAIWTPPAVPSATDPSIWTVQGYWWPPAHTAAQNDTYAGDQADYSEVLSGFVHRTCVVDGVDRDFIDVASDPELAGLITVDRLPLKVFRQPNVPVYACTARMPAAALVGGMCPLPPPPDNYDSDGGSGDSMLKIAGALAGAAMVGGLGYVTRNRWLPSLRRLGRHLFG